MLTTSQILKGARDLYQSSPSHAAPTDMPVAGSWCPITAVSYLFDGTSDYDDSNGYYSRPQSPYLFLCRAMNGRIVEYNATHTTEAVLEAFDRAIQMAESNEL